MRLRFIYCILLLCCFSCATTMYLNNEDLIGDFYTEYEDTIFPGCSISWYLTLKRDNTFYFLIDKSEASPMCEGTWEIIKDILILKCSEEVDLSEALSNGYMVQRVHKFKILNKNELKQTKTILKRQNPTATRPTTAKP